MAVAPLVAGWGRQFPNALAGPASTPGTPAAGNEPVTFGHGVPMRVTAELLLGGEWVDISPYVLYDDRITIVRGRKDEQSRSSPSSCRFTLKNQGRRFSPRNVTGPYYGKLRHNTKVRIWADPGSGRSLRFTGPISEWPSDWTTANDRFVYIEANGPLRRLGQGESLASSPEYASIIARTDLAAYWPLEGEVNSTTGLNAVTGGEAMWMGDAEWANDSGLAGSRALPKVLATDSGPGYRGLAHLSGGRTTQWTILCWFKATTTTVGFFYTRLLLFDGTPAGSVFPWAINVGQSSGGADVYVELSTTERSHVATAAPYDGTWHMVAVTAEQTSANNIAVKLYYDGVVGSLVSTASPFTLDSLQTIVLLPDASDFGAIEVWFGHLACVNSAMSAASIAALYQAGVGYVGETPATRFQRLSTEVGLTTVVNELVTDTQLMGAQREDEFLALARDCESTAEGEIDETFDGLLRLHSRTARYLPPITLQIDYAQGQLAQGFEVTDDDQATRNRWTISRDGGDSSTAMLSGTSPGQPYPLSIADVGLYDDSETLSLYDDSQAGHHAAWRVRRGTVDEPRWPSLTIALHRDPSLIPGWTACDISSRVQLINPPADVGTYYPVDQIIDGYTETLDQFEWHVEINGTPASGQNAFTYGDTAARYDCKGSSLTAALDTTATALVLTITDNCVWAHDYGDFNVIIESATSSEICTVTAVAAASGTLGAQTQTLTVTRSVNGAVQSHPPAATVRLAQPARYAL